MGILAICDLDEGYVRCFAEYFQNKRSLPFSIYGFSKEKELIEFLKEEKAEMLLISSKMLNEKIESAASCRIILLSEGGLVGETSEEGKYSTIYKFQSTEDILREVMEYYSQLDIATVQTAIDSEKAQTLGVYSPVSRCGKTTFAVTLGQVLAKKKRVLYVNMEEFSGLRILFGKDFTGDLSDLLYYQKLNPTGLKIKLKTVIHTINGLDMIPPMVFSEDLRGIDRSQWEQLLKYLAAECDYEVIVLDISNMVKNQIDILFLCDRVYMPVLSDPVAGAKVREFEHYLIRSTREQALYRIQKIQLPKLNDTFLRENYMERLLLSPMGDFAEKLLEDDNRNGNG